MQLSNLTSLDVALICEGLIHLMQEPHIYGEGPLNTWSKIAMQAFDFEADETMPEVKRLRRKLELLENPDLENLAEGLDTIEQSD